LALALFAVTLFVSAFILFLVQPIIGKTILPKLGGTPQVWNTCMVFFQTVLLLGYFYTHAVSTRLNQRVQLILHCFLLFLPFLILLPDGPFNIARFIPPLGANPMLYTLWFLAFLVGIPFFVVSTSAPLLQKWFGSTGHPAAKDPYFLYGASNLGSMLALVLYPFTIEQFMDLQPQKWLWTVGYGVLVVFVLLCAALIWKPAGQMKFKLAPAGPPIEPSSEGQPVPPPPDGGAPAPVNTGVTATPPAPVATAAKTSTAFKKGKPHPRPQGALAPEPVSLRTASDEMTTWRRLRWIGLAAVPSSLMLGVTTHITTDLSPIPLFWLIPLTIYLASFILVFSKWPVTWVEAPHRYMLYIQPALICLMIFIDILGAHMTSMWGPIAANVIAFGATALVCHGELAKDRPGTKHLTEFYLYMSLGGMLGGMFNGILAPVVFIYVWEFSIAVICACFLRPKMKDRGWADDIVAGLIEQPSTPAQVPAQKGPKGQHHPRSIARAGASETTTTAMDYALPIAVLALMFVLYLVVGMPTGADGERGVGLKYFLIFGIPLTITAFYFGRPMRFGLAVAFIMIFHSVVASRGDSSLYADRSYFGILRVKIGQDRTQPDVWFTQLIHGHINHGMNIFKPDNKADWGKADKDYSRLATTYYHRYGPAGIVMEKFNWFPGPQNTYWGDARMPASLVGQVAMPLGAGNLPVGQLVDLWSEPAYATIGLGTGTMASYGRPYQHVHYYEIDNHVRRLSLPLGKNEYYFNYMNLPQELPFTYKDYRKGDTKPRTFFNSLKDAIHRGCEVEVLMGDARLRMDLPYKNHHEDPIQGGGPLNFYHMMVVDAFSSDAIPVHLITKQALEMYFKHLREDGILCIHTSNRYVELPLVVAAVASDLHLSNVTLTGGRTLTGLIVDRTPEGFTLVTSSEQIKLAKSEVEKMEDLPESFAYRRGHDNAPGKELGRFTSEWVMVAKKAQYLENLRDPPNYEQQLRDANQNPDDRRNFYWTTPESNRRYLWTDDHSNLINVLRPQ
jgi:hypothetical protein